MRMKTRFHVMVAIGGATSMGPIGVATSTITIGVATILASAGSGMTGASRRSTPAAQL
jgi:hypothetical protein